MVVAFFWGFCVPPPPRTYEPDKRGRRGVWKEGSGVYLRPDEFASAQVFLVASDDPPPPQIWPWGQHGGREREGGQTFFYWLENQRAGVVFGLYKCCPILLHKAGFRPLQ